MGLIISCVYEILQSIGNLCFRKCLKRLQRKKNQQQIQTPQTNVQNSNIQDVELHQLEIKLDAPPQFQTLENDQNIDLKKPLLMQNNIQIPQNLIITNTNQQQRQLELLKNQSSQQPTPQNQVKLETEKNQKNNKFEILKKQLNQREENIKQYQHIPINTFEPSPKNSNEQSSINIKELELQEGVSLSDITQQLQNKSEKESQQLQQQKQIQKNSQLNLQQKAANIINQQEQDLLEQIKNIQKEQNNIIKKDSLTQQNKNSNQNNVQKQNQLVSDSQQKIQLVFVQQTSEILQNQEQKLQKNQLMLLEENSSSSMQSASQKAEFQIKQQNTISNKPQKSQISQQSQQIQSEKIQSDTLTNYLSLDLEEFQNSRTESEQKYQNNIQQQESEQLQFQQQEQQEDDSQINYQDLDESLQQFYTPRQSRLSRKGKSNQNQFTGSSKNQQIFFEENKIDNQKLGAQKFRKRSSKNLKRLSKVSIQSKTSTQFYDIDNQQNDEEQDENLKSFENNDLIFDNIEDQEGEKYQVILNQQIQLYVKKQQKQQPTILQDDPHLNNVIQQNVDKHFYNILKEFQKFENQGQKIIGSELIFNQELYNCKVYLKSEMNLEKQRIFTIVGFWEVTINPLKYINFINDFNDQKSINQTIENQMIYAHSPTCYNIFFINKMSQQKLVGMSNNCIQTYAKNIIDFKNQNNVISNREYIYSDINFNIELTSAESQNIIENFKKQNNLNKFIKGELIIGNFISKISDPNSKIQNQNLEKFYVQYYQKVNFGYDCVYSLGKFLFLQYFQNFFQKISSL